MDLLITLRSKVEELGKEKVCELLEVPAGVLSQFLTEKKAPGLKTCQKIVDLWTGGKNIDVPEQETGDGAIMDSVWDADGCLNMSYCPPEWGQKKAAWQGRDVCLVLPCYKDLNWKVVFNFMAIAMKYRQAIRLEMRQDSMIARSRNQLAKRFLDTGATWLISFDSDMLFPMGHSGMYGQLLGPASKIIGEKFLGINTIERLISWDRTIIGGCYWDRGGQGRLIAAGNQPLTSPIPSDTLYAAKFCGTGCLAINRQVFLDVAKKFPETFSDDRLGNESGFYTPFMQGGRMLGEDEAFGWRATEAGHPTYIDLGLICGHIGETVHSLPITGSKI